jgi:cell division protein FtsQ
VKSQATRKNRFKKNKRASRTRWRNRAVFTAKALLGMLALLATSGTFIFAYDYFTQTRHFQARQIVVTGHQRLSRQQVLDIAGVGLQTNILAVNLTATRRRLLADPWIADATVSRKIPSEMHIRIVEEVPLAILEMDAGQGFWINPGGEVFNRWEGSDSIAMLRVQGLNHADLPVYGKSGSEAFQAVMALLRLAGEKNSALPLSDIRRIWMDPEIGATVYTGEDQRAVKLGFGRYRKKCETLRALMTAMSKDSRLARCRVIDLFDVNRIVITLASAGPSGPVHKEV